MRTRKTPNTDTFHAVISKLIKMDESKTSILNLSEFVLNLFKKDGFGTEDPRSK